MSCMHQKDFSLVEESGITGDVLIINQADQNSEKSDDNFNFIKSEENSGSFFYDGKWLIYSGIAFIAISITGIVLTFRKPKTYKNQNKRGRSRNNSK